MGKYWKQAQLSLKLRRKQELVINWITSPAVAFPSAYAWIKIDWFCYQQELSNIHYRQADLLLHKWKRWSVPLKEKRWLWIWLSLSKEQLSYIIGLTIANVIGIYNWRCIGPPGLVINRNVSDVCRVTYRQAEPNCTQIDLYQQSCLWWATRAFPHLLWIRLLYGIERIRTARQPMWRNWARWWLVYHYHILEWASNYLWSSQPKGRGHFLWYQSLRNLEPSPLTNRWLCQAKSYSP